MSCNPLSLGQAMASGIITGRVTGKAGQPAVTVREYNGFKVANFSIRDDEPAYFKNKDDNPGQFWNVEVVGKYAERAAEQIERGTQVCVNGQLVWYQYNGERRVSLKNGKYHLLEWKTEEKSSDAF